MYLGAACQEICKLDISRNRESYISFVSLSPGDYFDLATQWLQFRISFIYENKIRRAEADVSARERAKEREKKRERERERERERIKDETETQTRVRIGGYLRLVPIDDFRSFQRNSPGEIGLARLTTDSTIFRWSKGQYAQAAVPTAYRCLPLLNLDSRLSW